MNLFSFKFIWLFPIITNMLDILSDRKYNHLDTGEVFYGREGKIPYQFTGNCETKNKDVDIIVSMSGRGFTRVYEGRGTFKS